MDKFVIHTSEMVPATQWFCEGRENTIEGAYSAALIAARYAAIVRITHYTCIGVNYYFVEGSQFRLDDGPR